MVLTDPQKMKWADETAINELGIPSTLLMERAAKALAERAFEYCGANKKVCIFCGSGNNGGDGIAAAIFLLRRGCDVKVLLTGSRQSMTADALEMERRLSEQGGVLEDFEPEEAGLSEKLRDCAVIIDAIFGIGLSRDVSGKALAAINIMNASAVPVVSADIASGVDAATGRIMGAAVKSAATVTFSMAKAGHFAEPGCTCCGKLSIADIGIPPELLEKCRCDTYALRDGDVTLPRREPISHKGSYGKLLVIGGSVGYTGAVSLCARAAVRSGAGLVSVAVPESIYEITAIKNDEAMPWPVEDECGGLSYSAYPEIMAKLSGTDVCAIGPGMGRGAGAMKLTRAIVENCACPMVIDADGLYALSEDMSVLQRAKAPIVLTPHEVEFRRMGGVLTGNRVEDARSFAMEHRCVLLLKGHRCIAAFPDGEAYICTRGNPGMAKGGSGDVLTGIIAAMMGQLPFKRAVLTGAFLHAYAGDLCRDRLGEYSMTAGDLVETLPEATKKLIEQE